MRVSFDTHTVLPLLAWELNSHFPIFLHSEKRKSGDYSFTASRIGGKIDFPVFLIPERRKAGSCTFIAVPVRGKTNFPVFLRSERRTTGNFRYASGTYGGNLSNRFFIRFSLLLLVGGSWVGA